jgi:hypothetical protein
VVHRAFAKAASLLLDRTLYYMTRRLRSTVINTFAGICIGPADAFCVSGIVLHLLQRCLFAIYYVIRLLLRKHAAKVDCAAGASCLPHYGNVSELC